MNQAVDSAKVLLYDYNKIQFLKHTKNIISFSLEDTVKLFKILNYACSQSSCLLTLKAFLLHNENEK